MKATLRGVLAATGLAVALPLFAPPAARAAPSCVDGRGEMIRGGTRGAMPVGWRLPPDQARSRLAAMEDDLDAEKLIGLLCVIGGLFALFALLPDFDDGWDRQEDDRERWG